SRAHLCTAADRGAYRGSVRGIGACADQATWRSARACSWAGAGCLGIRGRRRARVGHPRARGSVQPVLSPDFVQYPPGYRYEAAGCAGIGVAPCHTVHRLGVAASASVVALASTFVRGGLGYKIWPYSQVTWQINTTS